MIYSVFGSVGISMQINSTFSNILKLIALIASLSASTEIVHEHAMFMGD